MWLFRFGWLLWLVVGLCWGGGVLGGDGDGGAEVVYRNGSDRVLGFYAPVLDRGVEFGDEVALGGENRILSGLKVEYYSSDAMGSIVVRVRQQDGGVLSDVSGVTRKPGSIVYESPVTAIEGWYNSIVIDEIPFTMVLAERVTVTVEMSGLGDGQVVGPLMRNPPTVGESSDDIWVSDGEGDWVLQTIVGASANMAIEVVAVPEAGTVVLLGLGGVVFFGLRRWFGGCGV